MIFVIEYDFQHQEAAFARTSCCDYKNKLFHVIAIAGLTPQSATYNASLQGIAGQAHNDAHKEYHDWCDAV